MKQANDTALAAECHDTDKDISAAGFGRRFLTDLAKVAGGQGVVTSIGLVTRILLARILGPASFGVYGLITSAFGLTSVLANAGTQNAHVHDLGHGRATPGTALGFALGYSLVAGLLAIGAFFLTYHFWLYDWYFVDHLEEKYPPVLWVLFILPSGVLLLHLKSILLGLKSFGAFNVFLVFEAGLLLLFALVLTMQMEDKLLGVMVAWAASFVVPAGLTLVYLGFKVRPRVRFPVSEMGHIISYGAKAMASGLAQTLTMQLDLFIVGYFLVSEEVGLYFVASTLAITMGRSSVGLSNVLFPYNAGMEYRQALRLTNIAFRLVLTIGILALPLLIPLSLYLIPFVFGADYAKSALAFTILLPGAIALSLTRILYVFFLGQGRPGVGIAAYVTNLLTLVVLDSILVPAIGMNGAALGLSTAYSLGLAVITYRYITLNKIRLVDLGVIRATDLHLVKAAVMGR